MRRSLMLLVALVLAGAVQAGGGSVARADDTTTFGATLWAPYVSVDDTTIEIFNNSDAPTWPRIDITLRTSSAGTLVAEQRVETGAYCCGETGYFHTSSVSVDARDVDGLDDDATYAVVVTTVDGSTFAAVTTDAP